jgi:aminoglycoside 6-adenylyltransferase
MQFLDGNRIDLSFYALEQVNLIIKDSLSLVLLDKDNLIGELPPPSEAGYLPQKPSAKSFDDCCNEFWWLNPYVAKVRADNASWRFIRQCILEINTVGTASASWT